MGIIGSEWAEERLESLRRGLGFPAKAAVKRAARSAPGSLESEGRTFERSIEGFRLYDEGRYAEARSVFQELCVKEPKYALHRTALGLVHLAMDALPEAERELTRSIELSSREPSTFVTRGEVYVRLGRYLEAAKDFDRAVALAPEIHDPLAKRARLLATTAREMLAERRKKNAGPLRRSVRAKKSSSKRASKTRRK
jgi:tetratricopeptide (TPR) repeat protein